MAAEHRAVVKIVNKKGLHARASAKIVEAAARFQSRITVCKDGQRVDARSIMGLMMLAASPGAPPDRARIIGVMRRHGLTPAPPVG